MPNLQNTLSNSNLGIRIGLAYARHLPPPLGIPLAKRLGGWIASHRTWGVVRGARLNQWVARGMPASPANLDRAVRATFRSQASALYDMFRYLSYPDELAAKVVVPPNFQEFIAFSQNPVPGQGFVVVGVHLSNFDLALHFLTRLGAHTLAITLAELPGGYQAQYDQRRESGVELITASVGNFRKAIQRLKDGGVVLTGIDRPFPEAKHHPRFFGQPSNLPTHHITLALKARVPIRLMAVQTLPDGQYSVYISEFIHLQPNPADREGEITHNAERVLAHAEDLIRQAPEQWAMFLPVWPDLTPP